MTVASPLDVNLTRRWGFLVPVIVIVLLVAAAHQSYEKGVASVQQQRVFGSAEVQQPLYEERQLNWQETSLKELDFHASHFEVCTESRPTINFFFWAPPTNQLIFIPVENFAVHR